MAFKKKRTSTLNRAKPEGTIRQSQVVTTFGPGAMVDLVDRAIVVGGLEHWGASADRWKPLDDERLRRSLVPRLKALHPELDLARERYFRMPPEGDANDPQIRVGIRSLEFPRWFVCHGCRRLARASDQFENKGGRYRHDCAKGKTSHAVPVRFVAACKHGHLADFPWIAFVHSDKPEAACDLPELYLHEGAIGDVTKIFVKCKTCDAQQPMSRASSMQYVCNGDRPWLGGRAMNESCDQKLELLVRTASHAYFSQVVSALRLPPPEPGAEVLRVRRPEVWSLVREVATYEDLELLVRLVPLLKSSFELLDLRKVLAAILAERAAGDQVAERPLRSAEFERLTGAPIEQLGDLPNRDAQFAAYRVPPERVDLPLGVRGLVVVPLLREVRVQVSFSRFDSVSSNLQGEFDFDQARVKPASLSLPGGGQKWLPAAEVRGEGVFLELDEAAVVAWEARDRVKERGEKLLRAFEADARGGTFPGMRFYLLHSLSHLLMTAISLECGYAASSIRERIYCAPPEGSEPPMAAILLSTGTTGSEGTLGGLVEEGRRIRHHLSEAWDLGRLCSNDPVCAAHDPSHASGDRRTDGAACHGCLYIAETSCERFNRYLDRALVVPTIGNPRELAFFGDRP